MPMTTPVTPREARHARVTPLRDALALRQARDWGRRAAALLEGNARRDGKDGRDGHERRF